MHKLKEILRPAFKSFIKTKLLSYQISLKTSK